VQLGRAGVQRHVVRGVGHRVLHAVRQLELRRRRPLRVHVLVPPLRDLRVLRHDLPVSRRDELVALRCELVALRHELE
jgi:hypothetical protein